ncbi:MAG: Gfo/Idh/MocA family protein [Planctomycetota bacterium]|jgi:predicted dehydrogenase
MAVRAERHPAPRTRRAGARLSRARRAATIRAGVIGLGVGERHASAIAAHGGCEVAALCDVCPERLERVHRRFEHARPTTDAQEVLQDPGIDVVVVASFDDAHAAQVLAALEHGKHVFVEKPLCLRPDDAREIAETLRARPRQRLGCNLVLRRSPRFRRVRRMIGAGAFGTLFHVEADYLYGRLHKLTDGWRGRTPGYSVMLGGGVHMVDIVTWLAGARVVEVTACANGIASRQSGFPGPDLSVALLRLEQGMTAKVAANFGCVLPHQHGLTVFGTDATFVNAHPCGWLSRSRDPAIAPEPIAEPHPGADKGELSSLFVDEICGDRSPAITHEEIFHTMSVCFAIDRAWRERCVVTVEEPIS